MIWTYADEVQTEPVPIPEHIMDADGEVDPERVAVLMVEYLHQPVYGATLRTTATIYRDGEPCAKVQVFPINKPVYDAMEVELDSF